jgi:hypothetical protein
LRRSIVAPTVTFTTNCDAIPNSGKDRFVQRGGSEFPTPDVASIENEATHCDLEDRANQAVSHAGGSVAHAMQVSVEIQPLVVNAGDDRVFHASPLLGNETRTSRSRVPVVRFDPEQDGRSDLKRRVEQGRGPLSSARLERLMQLKRPKQNTSTAHSVTLRRRFEDMLDFPKFTCEDEKETFLFTCEPGYVERHCGQ